MKLTIILNTILLFSHSLHLKHKNKEEKHKNHIVALSER